MKIENDVLSVCPVTGLPVTSNPSWAYDAGDGSFSSKMSLIGDQILLIHTAGYAQAEDQIQSTRMRHELEAMLIPLEKRVILIFDWTRVKGVSYAARAYFLDHLNRDDRVTGVVFCSPCFVVRLSIKLGMRLKQFQFPLFFVNELDQAMAKARDLAEGICALARNHGEKNNSSVDRPMPMDSHDSDLAGYKNELLEYMGRQTWIPCSRSGTSWRRNGEATRTIWKR